MKRIILPALLLSLAAWPALADDFKIAITEPQAVAGIAWARAQHNAALPLTCPGCAPIGTDEEYVTDYVTQWAIAKGRQSAVVDLDAVRTKCMQLGDCADAKAGKVAK